MSTAEDPLRQQAWAYFALHAQQRLITLNFYLLLAAALTTATVASFQRDFKFPLLRVPAGALLVLFSFVFWRLDLRTRTLVKNAEAALTAYELDHQVDDWTREIPTQFLFAIERRNEKRRKTLRNQPARRWRARIWPESYSDA